MSGQPTVTRVGGDFNETLGTLEDFDDRIRDLEREGRMPANGASIIAVPDTDSLPDPQESPPDWARVVDEGVWYQVQAGGGGGQPGWSPSPDSPPGFP